MYDTLIEASELKVLLTTHSNICLFDCRFSLADTAIGKKLWKTSHIPGAYYSHLDDDLSSKLVPGVTGRHPLPKPEDFVNWLRLHGVNRDTQIIAYDSAAGAIACRLWWLCRWIGHDSCAVLDGGFSAWEAIGETGANRATPSRNGNIVRQPSLVKSFNTQGVIEHKSALLVDAREYPRYLGEQEPIDAVAGHIPGAISYPFPENIDKNGKFKSAIDLRSRFNSLQEQSQKKELIMYCGSGVTAIHNILAMTIAGFDSPTLYEDSWSGWILNSDREIAVGEAAE